MTSKRQLEANARFHIDSAVWVLTMPSTPEQCQHAANILCQYSDYLPFYALDILRDNLQYLPTEFQLQPPAIYEIEIGG